MVRRGNGAARTQPNALCRASPKFQLSATSADVRTSKPAAAEGPPVPGPPAPPEAFQFLVVGPEGCTAAALMAV